MFHRIFPMPRIYEHFLRPALFGLDAEWAHEVGIAALEVGLGSRVMQKAVARRFLAEPFGEICRFGLNFKNPLGMAAGFDKNGKVVNQLASLGFGFVEVGTVTYRAQPGNEKPRLFRLPQDSALINRLGFNNEGAAAVASRLRSTKPACVIGVNIGKNRDVAIEEATENYLESFELALPVADYIAVNVSSPNTQNLRDLQHAENLRELLKALQRRNEEMGPKPLLVKIAPDLEEPDIEQIVGVCMEQGVAGMIATNTTTRRDGLSSQNLNKFGPGGLSGRPLAALSNTVISWIYKYSRGRLPIIGVGGIFSAEDAFDKISAGASLLQAYTGFVYRGVSFAREINLGLAAVLRERGFSSLEAAVGSALKHD
jgi:dihydroorotate dehydrogenase